jgi:Protein of unknown function (DUF3987)/RepB DNA-primase N-terminal domain
MKSEQKPHIVVESSRGHFHVYWRVSDVELDQFADLQKALAARFGGDPAVCDLPRVMRLPGFYHCKGEPRLVTIVSTSDAPPYKATDFASAPADDPYTKLAQINRQHTSKSPTQEINAIAITTNTSWFKTLFPKATRYHGNGWRVKSKHLERELEEDISLEPGKGIKDFGVHDQGDPRSNPGGRTAIDLVMEWRGVDFDAAFDWLSKQVGYTVKQEPESSAPEPVDLWGHFDPPELPLGLLPDVIERNAVTLSEMMGADPAGLAMGALTVSGGVISDSIKLQVKRHQGWIEEPRLWCALVGPISSMKSPLMRTVTKPMQRIEARHWDEYLAAKAQYDALPADERKETPEPKLIQLRLEDTTIEGAQEALRDNVNGMLAVQDELSGWFGSMEKYSGGGRGAAKDRGFWLQSWNGGPYTVNRVARGVFRIENVSLSMLGGIQPDVIREIASNTYDDGLIQRLLPIVLRPGTLGQDDETSPVTDEYAELIERLYEMTPSSIEDNPFLSYALSLEGQHAVLQFDDAAQVIRRQLEQKHLELQQAFEVINKKLASHVGKYNGYFARLCIVFHCIEHSGKIPTYISERTAQRVAKFLHEFLFPHALAFYAGILNLTDDHDQLSAVAGYILAHKLERITNRDLARGDRQMKRLAKRDTEPVFEQLEALGWLTRTAGHRLSDPPALACEPEGPRAVCGEGRRGGRAAVAGTHHHGAAPEKSIQVEALSPLSLARTRGKEMFLSLLTGCQRCRFFSASRAQVTMVTPRGRAQIRRKGK